MFFHARKSRLARWRKIRGFSQEDLARRLGVTHTTISSWERDLTIPSTDQIHLLARVLRVAPGELFPLELH